MNGSIVMRRTLVQALAIFGISVGIAAASAWWHPRAPAWFLTETTDPWEIRIDQVAGLGEEVVWIDARSAAEHEKGHVPGSLLLNEDNWGDRVFELQDELSAAMGKPVVVYCDGSGCEKSRHIAERLRQLVGLDPVYVLKGDWRAVQ